MTPDLDHLHELRRAELAVWVERARLDRETSILEIGAGTGFQAGILAAQFGKVAAVDVAGSTYAEAQLYPVETYDGVRLPFADSSFDVVYTSHVLEHVPDLPAINREIVRVLKDGGRAIHIVPTDRWRIWTCLAHYPALPRTIWSRLGSRTTQSMTAAQSQRARAQQISAVFFAPAHGERGNRFTEFRYFRPGWWRSHFTDTGWYIADAFPIGLFYTGYSVAGKRLAMDRRRTLSRRLGSASWCYILQLGSKTGEK